MSAVFGALEQMDFVGKAIKNTFETIARAVTPFDGRMKTVDIG